MARRGENEVIPKLRRVRKFGAGKRGKKESGAFEGELLLPHKVKKELARGSLEVKGLKRFYAVRNTI